MSLRTFNDKIMEETGVTASSTSESISLDFIYGYSVYTTITEEVAALTGDVKLQVSVNGDDFIDLAGATENIAGSGNFIFNISDAYYSNVRVVLTVSGGTAGINTWINGKGI